MPSTFGTVPLKSAYFSTTTLASCSHLPFILKGPLPMMASSNPSAILPGAEKAAFGSGEKTM
jgi:hypothetical protein